MYLRNHCLLLLLLSFLFLLSFIPISIRFRVYVLESRQIPAAAAQIRRLHGRVIADIARGSRAADGARINDINIGTRICAPITRLLIRSIRQSRGCPERSCSIPDRVYISTYVRTCKCTIGCIDAHCCPMRLRSANFD